MKKSVLITYIISAILIVLSFVLVFFAIRTSYTTQSYRLGHMVYTSTVMVSNQTSVLLYTFSKMSFFLGVVGVIVATICQVTNHKSCNCDEKEKETISGYIVCDECGCEEKESVDKELEK